MPVVTVEGEQVSFEEGESYASLLEKLSPKKRESIIAVRENGSLKDLTAPVMDGAEVSWVSLSDPDGLDILRHSTAHIMACAVKRLFPEARVTIGPSIENGFYYDFDVPRPFTPEDLEKIEEEMGRIVESDLPFERIEVEKEEARKLFQEENEPYKIELLDDIEDDRVSLYRLGEFVDLCRGPHIPSSKRVKAYKLLQVAGAYWRGDERNPMLSRIYGTSFPDRKELKKYLTFLEEVKKRDHRRLGKELELFHIAEEVGPGLILWLPKGALVRKIIEDYWKDEHLKKGYEIVYTPHIAKLNLWEVSGHLQFYRENMFSPMEVEGSQYQIKPMNCPFHINIYKTKMRSYRDLPIRYAELGTVYRFERSGVLHGLMRVRGFTQDDAHIFLTEEQLEKEIFDLLDMTIDILTRFGFEEYDIYLSTRPEKFVGTLESWEKAEGALKSALEKKGLEYAIDPGEGVFYGPKIDIKIKDVLGRSWQCSTIQVDFNNPERFDVTYIGADGKEHRTIMIHRALMGSLERFFGILIEHYAGAFPLWLAPEQVAVLSITDRHIDYCTKVAERLREEGFRVLLDTRNEKLSYKIREAQVKKIPYALVAGDREVESGTVAPRKRGGENLPPMKLDEFIELLKNEL
ncbi:MAG: threonine--tRNA ligase [Deltaproteobacteria bacterium]|nr:MAG: threonine--tRNA ligase [Deltaproteobacteria bacterium]